MTNTDPNCIFCKIVTGQIPAAKVFEDEKCFAFLDIRPVNNGHTLVIPKEHFPKMTETPDETVAHMFVQSKRLMEAIKKSLNADYVAVSVVGIDVAHFHIHLIPRYFKDNLSSFWPTKEYSKEEQMKEIAEAIKKEL